MPAGEEHLKNVHQIKNVNLILQTHAHHGHATAEQHIGGHCVSNPIACVTMHGQVVDEFIHIELAIDIVKHLFKTNINSERGVPLAPLWV